MTKSLRRKSSRASDVELRPVWPERHPPLISPSEGRLRVISDRAALEDEARALRELVASGKVAWPPPLSNFTQSRNESSAGDLREVAPQDFDWRHPDVFLQLETVERIARARLPALPGEGRRRYAAEEQIRRAMLRYYMHAMWAHHGRRVYRLDTGLTDLLLQTKLPSLPTAKLRFPLHGFLIALPEGRFPSEVEWEPDPQPLDSIMVAVNRVDGGTDEFRELTLLLGGRSSRTPNHDSVVVHSVSMSAGTHLDRLEALALPWELKKLLDQVLHLTIGLALYLQSEHPALEPVPPPTAANFDAIHNRGKRRKAEQRYARVSKLGFVWVGRNESAGIPDLEQSETSPKASWSLDHQVWVAGHWKEQPYGPGNSLRRPLWIKPYIRGPDMADAMRLNAKRVQTARRVEPRSPSVPRLPPHGRGR